jgi:uncharacterized integral membrane protein
MHPCNDRERASCLLLFALITILLNLLQNANNAAVSIALPTIQHELRISEVQLKWVVTGYPLASVCVIFHAIAMSSHVPTRLVFS